MIGLEEPYLCIKVIFVGFSSVLWLVLGFGFWLEVLGKKRQTCQFCRKSQVSTGTQIGLEGVEYQY